MAYSVLHRQHSQEAIELLDFPKLERETLTVVEVSQFIGVSRDTIYEMVRRKEIPHFRVGSRILFRRNTLINWIDELELQNV